MTTHERPGRLPGNDYSDADIERVMLKTLDRAQRLHDDVYDLPAPELGSALLGDDESTDPHRVSHTAVRSIQAAAEHLDALRGLVGIAQLVHPSAPFTLVRGAIEAASAAVWVLAPAERQERGLHALMQALRNEMDLCTALGGLDDSVPPMRPSIDERRAEIDAIAAALGDSGRVKLPTSTGIVQAAEEAGATRLPLLFIWRMCSGFAHGRLWPVLTVLEHEMEPSEDPTAARLRVTNSLDRVLLATFAGLDVTEHALGLYRRRAGYL